MAAEFKIIINNTLTEDRQGFEKVIKQIDFTVSGTKEAETFSLPQTLILQDTEIENFITFEKITENWVVNLIERFFDPMEKVKAHIEYVLDSNIRKKNLIQQTLPWSTEKPVITPFSIFKGMKYESY